MITSQQLQTLLVNNLNDIRCLSSFVYIRKLLTREKFDNSLPQYRITDKVTNLPVVDMLMFIANIRPEHLSYVSHSTGSVSSASMRPISISLDNYEIKLHGSEEDNFITSQFGYNVKNIAVDLNYLNDNDSVLPLKIVNVRLF